MNTETNNIPTKYSSKKDVTSNNVVDVVVRIRAETGLKSIEMNSEQNINIVDLHSNFLRVFMFNKSFSESSTQEDVFSHYRHVIDELMSGIDIGLIAYGQTGSGKTYTITGTEKNPGLTIRLLRYLFDRLGQLQSYNVQFSLVEIYNEDVFDLLSKRRQKIDIILNEKEIIQNQITSADEAYFWYKFGVGQRSTASTFSNDYSSRSHSICKIHISTNDFDGTETEGCIYLVDLAGSERVSNSLAEGERLVETQNINRSLSALGDTIQALDSRQSHIPYRNSTLTYYLRRILHLQARIYMLCTIRPVQTYFPESLCTLEYATRLKKMKLGNVKTQIKEKSLELQNELMKNQIEKKREENKVQLNQLNILTKNMLKEKEQYKLEVEKLEDRLILYENSIYEAISENKEEISNLKNELSETLLAIAQYTKENDRIKPFKPKYLSLSKKIESNQYLINDYTYRNKEIINNILNIETKLNDRKKEIDELTEKYNLLENEYNPIPKDTFKSSFVMEKKNPNTKLYDINEERATSRITAVNGTQQAKIVVVRKINEISPQIVNNRRLLYNRTKLYSYNNIKEKPVKKVNTKQKILSRSKYSSENLSHYSKNSSKSPPNYMINTKDRKNSNIILGYKIPKPNVYPKSKYPSYLKPKPNLVNNLYTNRRPLKATNITVTKRVSKVESSYSQKNLSKNYTYPVQSRPIQSTTSKIPQRKVGRTFSVTKTPTVNKYSIDSAVRSYSISAQKYNSNIPRSSINNNNPTNFPLFASIKTK